MTNTSWFTTRNASVYESAYAYAQVMNQGLLAASLTDARDVLALNDREEAE